MVAADAVLQRLALDVLEDDERAALPVLPRVDDPDDVGVVELRDGAGLAAEALELVRVGVRDVLVHELDRHLALQHRVEGAEHLRHPPRPDLGVESVAPGEQGADGGAHTPIVDYAAASKSPASASSATRRDFFRPPWIWQTRDSLTPMMAPISARVRFLT